MGTCMCRMIWKYLSCDELVMSVIYLCEDDKEQLNYLNKVLEKYLQINNIDAQIISVRDNPKDTLSDVSKREDYRPLFFIDVEFQGYDMDGFDLAVELKRQNPDCFVVFLTSWDDLAYKVFEYGLEVLDYIVKKPGYYLSPRLCREWEDRFKRIFEKIAMELDQSDQDILIIENGSRISKIRKTEIIFIQTIKGSHYVEIYLPDKRIIIRQPFKEIKDQLDERFISVNRACVVQIDKICELDKKNRFLKLEGNYTVEISYREMKYVHSIFQEYCRKYNLDKEIGK